MARVNRLFRRLTRRRVIRRRVIVRGKVQGVYFRVSCRDEAQRAGVAGKVRNRSDGTVEAVFEGRERAVAAMIDWCRTGPERALVSEIDVVQEKPKNEVDFVVVRGRKKKK